MARDAILWELRGRSRETVTCAFGDEPTGGFSVTVRRGEQPVWSERFADAITAVQRAAGVAHQLMREGWTEVALPEVPPAESS